MPFDQNRLLKIFDTLPKKLRAALISSDKAQAAEDLFTTAGIGESFKQTKENMISFILGEISLEDFNNFVDLIAGSNSQNIKTKLQEIWFQDIADFLEKKNNATYVNPALKPDVAPVQKEEAAKAGAPVEERLSEELPKQPVAPSQPKRKGPDPYRETPQ